MQIFPNVFRVMSRIGGIINEMNNRTFIKERQINNRFIDLLNKQRIIAPLILDMYNVFPHHSIDGHYANSIKPTVSNYYYYNQNIYYKIINNIRTSYFYSPSEKPYCFSES